MSLRLWLRLFTCTSMIERAIRERLRAEFHSTLPRFDFMAQLARSPGGLKMNELSKRMMVSGGGVTGLTDQLETEGLVKRSALPNDRRAWQVQLTAKGRRAFAQMARAHERWIVGLLNGASATEQLRLYDALGGLKRHVQDSALATVGKALARKSL